MQNFTIKVPQPGQPASVLKFQNQQGQILQPVGQWTVTVDIKPTPTTASTPTPTLSYQVNDTHTIPVEQPPIESCTTQVLNDQKILPREPWNQLVTNYNPQMSIGMRTKRHFFPVGNELTFANGQLHTDETHKRRYMQHQFKEYYLIRTGNINKGIVDAFSMQDPGKHNYTDENFTGGIDVEARFFIWHQYYTPRWDTIDKPQTHINLTKTNPQSGKPLTVPLQDQLAWQEKSILRESSLMQHALGWQASVEFPVDALEDDDKVQIVEIMLEKIALNHHHENYKRFVQIFGVDTVLGPDFGKYFFTVDPEEGKGHPVTTTGGILTSIKAKDIEALEPGAYGYQFFENQIKISPNKIVVSLMQQYMIEKQSFEIQNTSREASISILEVFSSSPEILILIENNQTLPLPHRLKPGETLKITVLLIPETLELLECAIYVVTNPKYVFMLPVSIYVTNNMFGLKPHYYSSVNINENLKTKVDIYNPTDNPIVVLEAYSTEEFVTLRWPDGQDFSSEQTFSRDYSKLLTIPPKEWRTVLTANFFTEQIVDHNAMVHIMLDTGHIMRMPLYYHVYTDIVKFLPSIVDFGVVPLNFDAIRLPVSLKIRPSSGIKKLYLTQVMLPLNDVRLDFVMGEWDADPKGHVEVFNKYTKRMEKHRHGIINGEEEFKLMTVVMKPLKYGMIQTYLKLTFQQENGTVHKIELPIIGFVAPIHQLVIERKGNNFYSHVDKQYKMKNPFYGFLPAEPLAQVNVKSYIEEIAALNLTKTTPRDGYTELPMNIHGDFRGISTSSLEIIHNIPQMKFEYFQPMYSQVGSMETMQIGQFSLKMKDLFASNGRKYFFIAASHTFFPQYIQISDQKLVCTVQQESKPNHISDCEAGTHFDFGQIGLYQSKHRTMNITNIGHETVLLDWANKTHPNDELAISYKVSYQEYKSIYPELYPKHFNESETTEFLNRFTNEQRLGLFILPGHTVTFTFSLEGVMASLKAQKQTEMMTHAVNFSFEPFAYRPFNISYTYQVLRGSLSLLQNEIRFEPGFVGFEQVRELTMKSDFAVEIVLTQIHSTDARIMPVIKKKTVAPGEQVVVMDLIFDPGLSAVPPQNIFSTYNKPEHQEFLNYTMKKKTLKLSDLNIPNFSTVISEALKTVSSEDVALWRSYQSHSTLTHPTWIDGDWISGIVEDIRAVVTICTNIVGSIQVPIKAYIKRPQLTEARFLEFGGVQVGAYKAQSLELKNPFNETLYVNLFIGRNTVDGSDEAERVSRKQQHEGQTELLKHVKGTQYEAILKEEIQSRIETTMQFELHQQKLARLPDIQRFCKNVRILAAEKKSPSMQSSPEDRKEGETFQTLKDLESRFQQTISPGVPYEVDLRNDNDLEMCDLLHSTMALLPDSHFRTSTWSIINQYFFKRHQEVLELEAIINFQKVKEQNNLLANATDANSLKEHLMHKLQEQLRNMYPDSLKITDDVDYEIAKDINKSSFSKPIMWDPIREQNRINYQLAFPSPLDSGLLNFLSKVFSKKTFLAPGIYTFQFGREIMQTKSWAESGHKAITLMKNSMSKVIEYCLTSNSPQGHSVSKYVSNAYIDNHGRIKGINPAPALTRQWEIKDPKMHDEILMNNGTVGVEVLSQNFYINPTYQGVTFAIEPNKRLLLEDAIIFEPRSLLSKSQQMQMTLYMKSDKAVLQTLPLKGWASSAVLDITQVNKSVSFSNSAQSNSTQIFASYSPSCFQRMQSLLNNQSDAKGNIDSDCIDSKKSLDLIRNQTLGKSTIPQVVNLHVHDTDLLNFKVESFQKNFFARLLSPFETLSSMQSDYQIPKESQINQVVLWDFTFVNVGEIDMAIMNVYLEDPITGEKSCQQDGVSLWPCIDVKINSLKTKVFSLEFTSDFSVSEIRKTIVFESPDLIQRFPVQIDISPKALRYAAEYVSDEVKLYRPIFGAISHDLFSLMYLAMLATAGWVAYSLFVIFKNGNDAVQGLNQNNSMQFVNKGAQKGQKALESVQNVLAQVTPFYVQNQYVNTQERFRSHKSIFLRECVNLSQRKNSITIEYQRNLAVRLGKQQHVFIQKNSRQSPVYKAAPSPYEERQFLSERSNPEQQQQIQPLDGESDGTNTDELMQKTFATNRKTYLTTGKPNQRQTHKPKRVNKGKANYSVDFESKLQQIEPTIDKEDATSEALAQTSGKQDDSFTLVGQKDINALESSRFKDTSRNSVKDTLSDKPRSRSQSCNMIRDNNTNAGEEEQHMKQPSLTPPHKDASNIMETQRETELLKKEETRMGQDDKSESKKGKTVKGDVQTKVDAAESEEKTSENNTVKTDENPTAAPTQLSLGSQNATKPQKPRPMNKQEEMSLKKRKAKYELILKKNLLKKEKEAAEAELARKERDRLKLIQQKEDEERQLREKFLQEQEELAKLEKEREMQKKNEQQELESKLMREELEKALIAQQKSNQKFVEARSSMVVNDSKEGASREEQILHQVDAQTKLASNITQKTKIGTLKTLLKQKTPEGDSSFENIQPQSLAQAADPIVPFEEKSESETPQNKTHRRGISWGMSERLTITNESDGHSENNLDNSLNFVNQKELGKDKVDPRQTPDHLTEGSNNSTSYNTKDQPARAVYQSKKQQFNQKQYIAKQLALNPYGATTTSKRNDSQDFNPYGPQTSSNTEYTQKLYEQDTTTLRGRGKNTGIVQRGTQARGYRREVVQADEDYRDSAPLYFQSRRSEREIPGNYPTTVGKYDMRDHYKAPRAQNKRMEASHERVGNSDYEGHTNAYKQDGRGNPQYPIRHSSGRQGNERGGLDYYQGSQLSTRGGYGDLRQQQIYQERRGHIPYQGGAPYGRTTKENLTRRQYEEQNTQNYSAYYSGGKSRGEPQYSGRGQERHLQYFPPAEEDETYYEEVEYDPEEDYGEEEEEEVRPPRAYDLRREPPPQQYEEKGVEERYSKKSQQQSTQFDRQPSYYTNNQQNFYRKKPYQGGQHPQYSNAQYQEESFTPENEAFNDEEDQDEDYHQQQRRFQSRKDYEIRHSTSQYGGSTQADQSTRPQLNLHTNQQQSGYRRFVDDQSQSQIQQRYKEKVSRQHSGLQNPTHPPQTTSRYAVTNNPRSSKPFNAQHFQNTKASSTQVLQTSNASSSGNYETGGQKLPSQKASVSPHRIPTYEKTFRPGVKPYNAAQGNTSQDPSKVKKLNYIARGEDTKPQKNVLASSAVAFHPAPSQQPPSSDQSSEPARLQPKNPAFIHSTNMIQNNNDNWASKKPVPQPSDEDVVEMSMKPMSNQKFLDSEEDEDDLIESTKQFLKRPNSRHNSSVDLEEEEEAYRAPTVQKNFFSNFKRIQSIFNTTSTGPRNNIEAQDNNDSSQTGQTEIAQESSGSFFSGKNLNLFGGPKFDDYFRQDRHQQSLFGGGSSFYDQSANQQDLHSFHPEQQQVNDPQLQKQPSSLEALRMSSRPLQAETFDDQMYGAYQNPNQNSQQTLFSNAAGQDRQTTSSQANNQLQFKKLEPYRPSRLLPKEKAE